MNSFSVITPSFRSLDWLPSCAASVADQQGVQVEHLVQDGGSDDGTVAWLRENPRVRSFVERDSGMYDAINRGLARAQGEFCSHLNADEQYLPGALMAVGECFNKNPGVDVVLADTVVVDGEGRFICCRKSAVPRPSLLWVHNPTITSSIFFRRRAVEQHGLWFDTQWRILGDAVWLMTAMEKNLRMAVLRRFTSTFADTGDNLYFSPKSAAESAQLQKRRPRWVGPLRGVLRMASRLDRWKQGALTQAPFSYALYTRSQPDRRTGFFVAHPTTVWWNRSARGASTFNQKLRRRFFSGPARRP